MKRGLLFFLPQVILMLVGFSAGYSVGVVTEWRKIIAPHPQTKSTTPEPHRWPALGHELDDVILVLFVVAVAAWFTAIVPGLMLAGVKAGLVGAMYGFVLSCLVDWVLLSRKQLSPREGKSVKRWAGRGAATVAAVCVGASFFNPIRDVAGVFAVTGTLVCLAFGMFGLLRLVRARRV